MDDWGGPPTFGNIPTWYHKPVQRLLVKGPWPQEVVVVEVQRCGTSADFELNQSTNPPLLKRHHPHLRKSFRSIDSIDVESCTQKFIVGFPQLSLLDHIDPV